MISFDDLHLAPIPGVLTATMGDDSCTIYRVGDVWHGSYSRNAGEIEADTLWADSPGYSSARTCYDVLRAAISE